MADTLLERLAEIRTLSEALGIEEARASYPILWEGYIRSGMLEAMRKGELSGLLSPLLGGQLET